MKFDLDAVFIEEGERDSALARRVVAALPGAVPVEYVADGREAARARIGADPFDAGKRRMVLMRRRAPFLMSCPAGSARFACCGYLVMILASNCPMDCSYCFLQEFVADNPGFQVFSNYADSFEELERMINSAPERHFRIGTGELADSLAFDTLTGLTRDLVGFFAARETLTLELKTKTDEIENLLALDPRGRVLVSWTLSPEKVWRTSEHRTASPAARIAAARRVLDAGYRIAFHFDPVIAYEGAERDYAELIDNLLDVIPAAQIGFFSIGGLRMTPALRAAARRRWPDDRCCSARRCWRATAACAPSLPCVSSSIGSSPSASHARARRFPATCAWNRPAFTSASLALAPANPATIGERLALGQDLR